MSCAVSGEAGEDAPFAERKATISAVVDCRISLREIYILPRRPAYTAAPRDAPFAERKATIGEHRI